MDLNKIIQEIMANMQAGKLPTQNPELAAMPSNPGAIDSQILSKYEGASPRARFEAQYPGNILNRNYEGGRDAVARQIGPGMVNELSAGLPGATKAQMRQIAAILSQAGNQDDQMRLLRSSGGPR